MSTATEIFQYLTLILLIPSTALTFLASWPKSVMLLFNPPCSQSHGKQWGFEYFRASQLRALCIIIWALVTNLVGHCCLPALWSVVSLLLTWRYRGGVRWQWDGHTGNTGATTMFAPAAFIAKSQPICAKSPLVSSMNDALQREILLRYRYSGSIILKH